MKQVVFPPNQKAYPFPNEDILLIKNKNIEDNITLKDFKQCLSNLDVQIGDSVVVHSEVFSLGRIGDIRDKTEFVAAILGSIRSTIGSAGHIIIPTFTYSACKEEVFNPYITKPTIGLIANESYKIDSFCRSSHPIFSYACSGPNNIEFLQSNLNLSFAEGSINHKLLFNDKIKFLFIGSQGLQMITCLHSLEVHRKVMYRETKSFTAKVEIENQITTYPIQYLVRSNNYPHVADFTKLQAIMKKQNLIRYQKIGIGEISTCTAQDLVKCANVELDKDPDFLIKKLP